MAQETFYFPHDYSPFDDMKFEAFVIKHGVIGYGVFWRLIEMLHSNEDHLLELEPYVYESVGAKLKLTPKQVEVVIDDCISKYYLFKANGGVFWSERVFKNVEKRKSISKQRSEAGKASAEQRRKDRLLADMATDVEQPLTGVEQPSTKKERKKEII